jgi:hypothetical protein
MKHSILVLFLILCCYSYKAQHYTKGITFDSTIASGNFLVNSCTQTMQTHIELDASLFNYVSGMQFMMIFDTVNSIGPSSIQSGDTLILNDANPIISIISGNGTNYWYRIKIVGTPTNLGQTYPCSIEFSQCTCFCFNAIIRASLTNTSTCIVDQSNAVSELKSNVALTIFPNPASHNLSINGITKSSIINIYDGYGKLVLEKESCSNTTLNISELQKGVYTLVVIDDSNNKSFMKVAITN